QTLASAGTPPKHLYGRLRPPRFIADAKIVRTEMASRPESHCDAARRSWLFSCPTKPLRYIPCAQARALLGVRAAAAGTIGFLRCGAHRGRELALRTNTVIP